MRFPSNTRFHSVVDCKECFFYVIDKFVIDFWIKEHNGKETFIQVKVPNDFRF